MVCENVAYTSGSESHCIVKVSVEESKEGLVVLAQGVYIHKNVIELLLH